MYDEKLLTRPQIVVLNKVDMPDVDLKIAMLKHAIERPLFVISAIHKKDIDQLLYYILETLKHAPEIEEDEDLSFVSYTHKKEEPKFIVTKTEDGYELSGDYLKLLFERTDFTKDEAVKRFARQLRGLGVDDKLREMGAKHMDTIYLFGYAFDFID